MYWKTNIEKNKKFPLFSSSNNNIIQKNRNVNSKFTKLSKRLKILILTMFEGEIIPINSTNKYIKIYKNIFFNWQTGNKF